jgi:hypothetical protein
MRGMRVVCDAEVGAVSDFTGPMRTRRSLPQGAGPRVERIVLLRDGLRICAAARGYRPARRQRGLALQGDERRRNPSCRPLTFIVVFPSPCR